MNKKEYLQEDNKELVKHLKSLEKDDNPKNIKRNETKALDILKTIESNNSKIIEFEKMEKKANQFATKKTFNNLDNNQAIKQGFALKVKGITTGDMTEFNKFLTTADTDGETPDAFGDTIPTIVANDIMTKVEDYGNLIAHISKISIKGLYRQIYEISSTGVTTHLENDPAIKDEEIVLGSSVVDPEYLKKTISWSHKLEAMSAINLYNYLVQEFARKFAIQLETDIIFGSNDKDGKLLTDSGTHGIVPTANGLYPETAVDANELAQNIYDNDALGYGTFTNLRSTIKVPQGKQARIYMNEQTFWSEIMGMVDTTNRPLVYDTYESGKEPTHAILGMEILFTDALPAYDKTRQQVYATILVDDAFEENFPEGQNVTFINDDITGATENKKRLTGRLLCGGGLKQLNSASVLYSGSEPTPPDNVQGKKKTSK